MESSNSFIAKAYRLSHFTGLGFLQCLIHDSQSYIHLYQSSCQDQSSLKYLNGMYFIYVVCWFHSSFIAKNSDAI